MEQVLEKLDECDEPGLAPSLKGSKSRFGSRRGLVVLVDESAESVAAVDLFGGR
jgi:hypothetical protein